MVGNLEGSTPEKRKRIRQDFRRNDILAIAEDLFSQKGYDQTKIREIAERAGLTKTGIYYYFNNKEEIAIALAIKYYRIMNQMADESVNHASPGLNQLKAVIFTYPNFIKRYPFAPSVFSHSTRMEKIEPKTDWETRDYTNSLRDQLSQERYKIHDRFNRVVREGQELNLIRVELSMERITRILSILIGGFMTAAKMQEKIIQELSLTTEDALSELIEWIYYGIKPFE